jgi:hypothetical protein
MNYEHIYVITGDITHCMQITQIFEGGNYDAVNLCNSEQFSDIYAVASVLKNYLRALPTPLLTFELHDGFLSAAQIPNERTRTRVMRDLVQTLPPEHYRTLKLLMLHLHRSVIRYAGTGSRFNCSVAWQSAAR